MVASATTMIPVPARRQRLAGHRADLRSVECRMREAAALGTKSPGPVQHAVAHHLESGGNRTRARLAIGAGHSLQLSANETEALAAGAELLHNASLIHDDLQDNADTRRGRPSVWAIYGSNIAICAGDLLVSAAYSAVASGTQAHITGKLVQCMHDATTRVINGQAADLAAQTSKVAEIETFKQIARGKSGPLLSLPVEMALATAGFDDYTAVAREATEQLAVAYQIADDLEDEAFDSQAPDGGCLNAINVLRSSGCDHPRQAARNEATFALRDAVRLALYLPLNSGEPIIRCVEVVRSKLKAAS